MRLKLLLNDIRTIRHKINVTESERELKRLAKRYTNSWNELKEELAKLTGYTEKQIEKVMIYKWEKVEQIIENL